MQLLKFERPDPAGNPRRAAVAALAAPLGGPPAAPQPLAVGFGFVRLGAWFRGLALSELWLLGGQVGVASSGTKAELVRRLIHHMSGNHAPTPGEAENYQMNINRTPPKRLSAFESTDLSRDILVGREGEWAYSASWIHGTRQQYFRLA